VEVFEETALMLHSLAATRMKHERRHSTSISAIARGIKDPRTARRPKEEKGSVQVFEITTGWPGIVEP
jgi:hypothetical protein